MKVRITQEFHDITNPSHIFKIGEVVEFEKERAENIIRREMGVEFKETPKAEAKAEAQEVIPEPQPEKPKKKTTKKKVENDQ